LENYRFSITRDPEGKNKIKDDVPFDELGVKD